MVIPYSIDIHVKIPARQAILAAYRLKIPVDIFPGKGLDLVTVLRLNKHLDAFHYQCLRFTTIEVYAGIPGSYRKIAKRRQGR